MTLIKAPFNPKGELFHWGPIPGRYFYAGDFKRVYPVFEKPYEGYAWSHALFLFLDKRIYWVEENMPLRAEGKRVFARFILPKSERESVYARWMRVVKEMHALAQDVTARFLAGLSGKELQQYAQKLQNVIYEFWKHGIIVELANYGADALIHEALQYHIYSQVGLIHALQVLTAPEEPSFYQEEEFDLAETGNLEKHQQKYFWLRNSYAGAEILPVAFFEERKTTLPPSMRRDFQKRLAELQQEKKTLIVRYHLPQEIQDTAEAISAGIAWQDERKKHIFIMLHYKELVLLEVSRRLNVNADALRNLTLLEILGLLDTTTPEALLEQRKNGVGFDLSSQGIREMTGEETAFLWKLYTSQEAHEDAKELKGIVASAGAGSVQGRVRIVLDSKNAPEFAEGEILVAPMTSPEYVFLMKKAAAIVTDAGGLTSHAAIVAREMKKPCIVGVKHATRILSDGDEIEVDASKGVVNILTRQSLL